MSFLKQVCKKSFVTGFVLGGGMVVAVSSSYCPKKMCGFPRLEFKDTTPYFDFKQIINPFQVKKLQSNRSYSGKEFIELNTTDYYRIIPKDLFKMSEKEFLSIGRFEYRQRDDFVKNFLPEFDNKNQRVLKAVIDDESSDIFVESYLAISGEHIGWISVDSEVEFK